MEKQTTTVFPRVESGHDRILRSYDMERVDVCHEIRITSGSRIKVKSKI